jgi:ArsR family transcriptional regulator
LGREQRQLDTDLILDILGNDTRRKILAVVSDEPMYFNQLAKEVHIGQQAVIRHLQALEDSGLIETYAEKSEFGAPDRKYYRLNNSFILTVSLSEDDFTIKKQDLTESVQNKQSKKYNKMLDSMPEDTGAVLSLLQEQLADVEDRISALELQLNDLRALKQLILNRLHKIGMDSFEQDERRIIYKIIEESPRSIAELSKIMGEKESDLKGVIKEIRNRMDIKRTQVLFENLK